MKTVDGRLTVISGASRCGKTTYLARRLAASRRVVAWDPDAQWCDLPGYRKITKRHEFVKAIQTPGHMKLAFVPGQNMKADFDFVCGCVMYAGRYINPLDFVPEELADVTNSGKAVGNWGLLVRRGLKRGINLYPISQRWAEADKTAFGNASEYVVFTSIGDDVDYIAKKLRLPVDEIESLKPLEYIIFDRVTKEKIKKKVRF